LYQSAQSLYEYTCTGRSKIKVIANRSGLFLAGLNMGMPCSSAGISTATIGISTEEKHHDASVPNLPILRLAVLVETLFMFLCNISHKSW
jgi:hypothetical protein